MYYLRYIMKDPDLLRIRNKIDLLKNILTQGTLSILIKLLVSWMVTLEITNGIENISIQEILKIFNERLEKLDQLYDELQFAVQLIREPDGQVDQDNTSMLKLKEEKQNFRIKVYKLFDLNEILLLIIKKCVFFGTGINRVLPLLTNYFSKQTVLLIDTLLLTDTDIEFETKILEYIAERTETIEDPVDRKMKKIGILYNILDKVVSERIPDYKDKPNTSNTINNLEAGIDMHKLK
jgi:hypothetical protein